MIRLFAAAAEVDLHRMDHVRYDYPAVIVVVRASRGRRYDISVKAIPFFPVSPSVLTKTVDYGRTSPRTFTESGRAVVPANVIESVSRLAGRRRQCVTSGSSNCSELRTRQSP